MIVLRNVMRAQFGRGGELAALFRESSHQLAAELNIGRRWRVLSDLAGPFDTVVLEWELESLAEWEQTRGRLFASHTFGETMPKMQALIVSGAFEIFTVEDEG